MEIAKTTKANLGSPLSLFFAMKLSRF